jgi:hypothetical protein
MELKQKSQRGMETWKGVNKQNKNYFCFLKNNMSVYFQKRKRPKKKVLTVICRFFQNQFRCFFLIKSLFVGVFLSFLTHYYIHLLTNV